MTSGELNSATADAEDYPETAAGMTTGAGAEAEIVPPVTQVAPTAEAWSCEEPENEPLRQSWGQAWSAAAVLVMITAVALLGIAGWAAMRSTDNGTPHVPTTPPAAVAQTSSVSAPETPTLKAAVPAPSKDNVTPLAMPSATAQHLVPPPPPVPESTPDDDFLRLLREDGFVVYDPAQAEAIGHLACANLALTHNIYYTHMYVKNVLGIPEPNAKELAIVASVAYCPDTPS